MGAGGATWDTAGTLTLDSDNTFALADAVTDEPPYYDQAWWTYTPTTPGVLSLSEGGGFSPKLFSGTTGARVAEGTFGDAGSYLLREGVEYHAMLWRGLFDPTPTAYVVTAAFTRWRSSPWLDDLQDDPDNYLIVTTGDLRLANPDSTYSGSEFSRPDWMNDVLRGGQGRHGSYFIVEALGGDDVINGMSCARAHAENGDFDDQVWNATGTGSSGTTPPICLALGTGDAHIKSDRTSTRFDLSYAPSHDLLAGHADCEIEGPSYAFWHLPVRDNVPPRGVVTPGAVSLDPVDHGYPEDAVLVYEDATVGLLGVSLADGDPLPSGDAPYPNLWVLNDALAPTWTDGFTTPWQRGTVGTGDLSFTYDDGNDAPEDIEWHALSDTDGWDGHGWTSDYGVESDATDDVIIAWPAVPAGDTPFVGTRDARIAVKFQFQASRFRFVYPGSVSPLPEGGIPPRRIFPRNDGATQGSRRFLGGGNTRQAGSRTLGSIL